MAQRTWFITGINSGFGRHMTEQLLERSGYCPQYEFCGRS